MLKSREELVLNYWLNEQRKKESARMRREAKKREREELARPEYTIGIVNSEGQLEIVQAKPLSDTLKRLPEVLLIVLISFMAFALAEGEGLWL